MNKDSYNEVINGEDTFKKIASCLMKEHEDSDTNACIIGWTDGIYDHRDIMFTYRPVHLGGGLQRGLRWCYLYVSIMGYFSMGFLIEDGYWKDDGTYFMPDNRKSNGYIMEKLNLHDNHCDIEICNLINGVIHEIDVLKKKYATGDIESKGDE